MRQIGAGAALTNFIGARLTVAQVDRDGGAAGAAYWTDVPFQAAQNAAGTWTIASDGVVVPKTGTYIVSVSYVLQGAEQFANMILSSNMQGEIMKISERRGNPGGATAAGVLSLTAGERVRWLLSSDQTIRLVGSPYSSVTFRELP